MTTPLASLRDQDRLGRFSVGPSGPAFWRGVIELQQSRLERSQDLLDRHDWSPVPATARDAFEDASVSIAGPRIADALMLLVGIRRLVAVCERLKRHTRDPAVQQALHAFWRKVPDAKDLRDVLEHLDAYAVGEGLRDETGAQGHWWPRVGADPQPFISIGRLHVNLQVASEEAVMLALKAEAALTRWRAATEPPAGWME